jgi:hypothetical protein
VAPSIVTPYADHSPLSLGGIKALPSTARYGIEELLVSARGTYDNPFDPEEVSMDAAVTSP